MIVLVVILGALMLGNDAASFKMPPRIDCKPQDLLNPSENPNPSATILWNFKLVSRVFFAPVARALGLECLCILQIWYAKWPDSQIWWPSRRDHHEPSQTQYIGSKESTWTSPFWAQIWLFAPPLFRPILSFYFLFYFCLLFHLTYLIYLPTKNYFILSKKSPKILFFTN